MSKKRWTLFIGFIGVSLACALSVFRVGAANPSSGTMTPDSPPLMWNGTAAGGVSADESTCADGVNCDTFRLTVSGTPADWVGKKVQIDLSWVVLANDYDMYIHKCPSASSTDAQCNATDPTDSSTSGMTTSESAEIDPVVNGTGVFTVHVVYFTGTAADQYHAVARVMTSDSVLPPPTSPDWTINYHGTCCEGNLAAAGDNTYVLLPVLVNGNKIKRSTDGGQTWVQTYPPVNASVPYGIEGDMQAFGNDVIFFGTELADGVIAKSTDGGLTWSNFPVPLASAGNDQAWAYLGPLSGMRQPTPLPGDAPYVLAGWMRIGTALAFSFDGGQTWTNQTTLVGNNGDGPEHVACHQNAVDPPAIDPGDTRVANALFARQKSGRHGSWGTDRKFYWTETVENVLYVCQTDDFITDPPGVTWMGNKHPVSPGPSSDFVVTHSAFDNNGTFYVLHGNKLYVSFNQGKTFAFTHTLPRHGDAGRSDSGSDQYFVVDCGTIHIGLLEDGGGGTGRVYYLRGSFVDTATPSWEDELVDVVNNVRLDFMYIVLNGNGIPTISYTTPGSEITTASRNSPMPPLGGDRCSFAAVSAVSRKTHEEIVATRTDSAREHQGRARVKGGKIQGVLPANTFDVPLLQVAGGLGIECRTGGENGEHQIVVTFPTLPPNASLTFTSAAVTGGTGSVAGTTVSGNEVTINLTGVANAQVITVTLFGVSDGTNTSDVAIPMGVLLGDTTSDRFVNSADISQTKSQSGQPVTESNFRMDVNIDALINSGDISQVKSQSGTALP